LGDEDNYWTMLGAKFRAIRIPEADKSFRAKRIVSEGRASAEHVHELERSCLSCLRQFDAGTVTIGRALDVIAGYDHLITADRPEMLTQYRRTLEAKPWRVCPCEICRRDGIDVIIFRGNNRNRRRGFHNTYVFYRLLQRVLETGDASFLSQDDDDTKPTPDGRQLEFKFG